MALFGDMRVRMSFSRADWRRRSCFATIGLGWVATCERRDWDGLRGDVACDTNGMNGMNGVNVAVVLE
jgi:hypothetical protein